MAVKRKRRKTTAPTKSDWGKIHAKAWTNHRFRRLLETDPKRAIQAYGREVGKSFHTIVKLERRPRRKSRKPLHQIHPFPPSCC